VIGHVDSGLEKGRGSFLKKRTKKLLRVGGYPRQAGKSLFASFSSEKEGLFPALSA
jgi:hypothetical protein